MFTVEYVTPARAVGSQSRLSFGGAHTLARILLRKGCRSVSVTDPGGKEVYYLNGKAKTK